MAYEAHDGYQKFHDDEPLILEPEDWSFQEWATICKLCGLPLGQTERIVLHVDEMECFVNLSKKAVDSERTYTVTEMCPHCESEIEMCWDTDTMGFKAFCPVCGERLMLCDECHQLGGGCDYDGKTDSCQFNQAEPETENRTIVLPVAPGERLYLTGYSADEPTAIKAVVQRVDACTNLITGTHHTICVEVEDLGGNICEFSDILIGKEFFRTKEEAIKDAERRKCEAKTHARDKGVL